MTLSKQIPLQFEHRANQTFDDFFPSTNSEIIDQLQRSIAGNGEQLIFLWGKSGLGKSHLLQATCKEAQRMGLESFYITFSSHKLPEPSLLQGLEAFDVVCFDNIEHIAGNKAWEQAFFNFFNQQRDQGHYLVLSAECAPNKIAIQLPDLITRLNWGLTLKIQPVSDIDKISTLIFKASKMGFKLSPQAGRFLLTHYNRDFSSLWDLLIKLDRASLAAKRKLTIPFLKKVLSEEN
jgi:DnaA family protein